MKNKLPLILFAFGFLLMFAASLALLALDSPLPTANRFTFITPAGDELAATYYPGRLPKGALLFTGFGSDQVMMRPAVVEFSRAGLHVFTFDFSGQGRSPGALAYDNAATGRLAGQAQAAIEQFMALSGLDSSQILWVGHSLGARVALQSASHGPIRPAGLALFGAQVNLSTNTQAEFFTGTSDADLAWVQALAPDTPPVPVLLVLGEWDDILTPQAAHLLMEKLCATDFVSPDIPCGSDHLRTWSVLDGLVHNYEIFSPRALGLAKTWSADVLAEPEISRLDTGFARMRILAWVGMFLGVYTFLVGAFMLARKKYTAILPSAGFEVIAPNRFAWVKLALWLAALPLSALLMFVFMLIPLSSPTFNLIYGGFLGGYGLLMLILYLLGCMPGTKGKLRLPLSVVPSVAPASRQGWGLAVGFNLLLFVVVTVFYRSGLGLVPPEGERFAWVLIFTPLTALGFWIGAHEGAALARSFPKRKGLQLALLLNGLVPFFLYFALLGGLGSISGMLGALTSLFLLALVLIQGEITRRLTGASLFAAVLQSLLLYWVLLPAGALFPPMF